MSQTALKIIGIFGGGTVMFYTLGFTVVRTYMHKIGLEGMFLLSKEFYVDAGASFMLEMISAPLLTPHIFFIYLVLLFFLVPSEKKLVAPISVSKKGLSGPAIAAIWGQRIRLSVLMVVIIITALFANQYESFMGEGWFAILINAIVPDPTVDELTVAQMSRTYFSLVTPLIIVLSSLLYRYIGALSEKPPIKRLYQIIAVIYVVFIAIVPIYYGLYLYDWKLVPIKDPQYISNVIQIERGTATQENVDADLDIWLFGHFNDKYYFFTKSGDFGEGVIEVIDEDKIKILNFVAYQSVDEHSENSLREKMVRNYELEDILGIEIDVDPFEFLDLE